VKCWDLADDRSFDVKNKGRKKPSWIFLPFFIYSLDARFSTSYVQPIMTDEHKEFLLKIYIFYFLLIMYGI
jgi:hypothetical protein